MYVCMYVRTHVCMFACLNAYLDTCMHLCIHVTHACMHDWPLMPSLVAFFPFPIQLAHISNRGAELNSDEGYGVQATDRGRNY